MLLRVNTWKHQCAVAFAGAVQMGFNKVANAPSRGALTTDFLTATQTPLAYLRGIDLEVRQVQTATH